MTAKTILSESVVTGGTLSLPYNIDVGNHSITNLGTPSAATDAVTKAYSDIEKSLNNWVNSPVWQYPTSTPSEVVVVNSVFFCYGASGGLSRSTDGINWTPIETGLKSNVVKGIAYGASTYVLITTTGQIASSSDGITWTQRFYSGTTSSVTFGGIVYANSLFTVVASLSNVGMAFSSSDGITWSIVPLKTGTTLLNAVAYGASTFVAVGVTGTVFYSSNGTTWTQTDCKFGTNAVNGVIFANSLFVAFGAGGALSTSGDGITWTAQDSKFGSGLAITSVDYGASVFVAVGPGVGVASSGTVCTSPDGVNWTQRLTTPTVALNRVRFLNSLFLVGGTGVIYSSSDGISWTLATPGPEYYGGIAFNDFAYGASVWVAVGSSSSGGVTATSSDGVTWTQRTNATLAQLNGTAGVMWDGTNSIFVSWHSVSTTNLATSTDGITWTARAHALTTGCTKVIFANSTFVAMGGAKISTSPTGVTWTLQTSNMAQLGTDIIYANSLYVVVGGNSGAPECVTATTATSTWTSRITQFTSGISGVTTFAFSATAGTHIAYLNSLFVAWGGANGYILTSSDGLAWTSHSISTGNGFNCATYGAGVWVLAGPGAFLVSSSDGATWTSRTSQFTSNAINSLATDGTTLVAVGAGGLISSSTDGTAWTLRLNPGFSSSTPLNRVIYANSLFVAVGSKAAPSAGASTQYTVVTSSNGTTWTNAANPQLGQALASVAYGASVWVAVSSIGAASYSSNATSWTDANCMMAAPNLTSMAFGASVYVAVGAGTILSSSNGTTWTPRNVAVSVQAAAINGVTFALQTFNAVIYANSLFVAVGSTGLCATSSDGVTWTARDIKFGTNDVTGVTYANSVFVAWGINGQISSSSDGTTWTARTSGFDAAPVKKVRYLNSLFVAVGGNGKLSTSSDGATWTARNSQASSNVTINDVAYGSSVYVTVGSGGFVASSSDATTWTFRNSTVQTTLLGIAFGNSVFVVIATATAGLPGTLYSSDGTTWNQVTTRLGLAGNSTDAILFSGGYFILARPSLAPQTSVDGVIWLNRGFSNIVSAAGQQAIFALNNLLWIVGGSATQLIHTVAT